MSLLSTGEQGLPTGNNAPRDRGAPAVPVGADLHVVCAGRSHAGLPEKGTWSPGVERGEDGLAATGPVVQPRVNTPVTLDPTADAVPHELPGIFRALGGVSGISSLISQYLVAFRKVVEESSGAA